VNAEQNHTAIWLAETPVSQVANTIEITYSEVYKRHTKIIAQ